MINKMDEEKIKESIRNILEEIGEDVNREGIKSTPDRVARLYKRIFYGYRKKLVVMNEYTRNGQQHDDNVIPITIFKNEEKEMLIRSVKGISHCEHHLSPITYTAFIGIIPDQYLLGMNKIDKIVKYFGARLQIQERMTSQIADWINDNIKPLGVIVIIKGDHFCAKLQDDDGEFTTSSVRGVFLKPEPGKSPKEEFLKLIQLK